MYYHETKGHKEADKAHINKYKMAHCIGVAEYMRENAEKYGLDKNEMYTLGLLHDIGYLEGRVGHEENGYEILEGLGMNDKYLFAVINHGTNPYEVEESVNMDLLVGNAPLVLLYEADMSIDARGYNVGFDGRLKDIGERYGYDHIAYQTASDTVNYVKEAHAKMNFKEELLNRGVIKKRENAQYGR